MWQDGISSSYYPFQSNNFCSLRNATDKMREIQLEKANIRNWEEDKLSWLLWCDGPCHRDTFGTWEKEAQARKRRNFWDISCDPQEMCQIRHSNCHFCHCPCPWSIPHHCKHRWESGNLWTLLMHDWKLLIVLFMYPNGGDNLQPLKLINDNIIHLCIKHWISG